MDKTPEMRDLVRTAWAYRRSGLKVYKMFRAQIRLLKTGRYHFV